MDRAVYLTPFLDVIQSDEIQSAATSIALYSVLKLLSVEIFGERTIGARDAINSVVMGLTECRLEQTDLVSKDAVVQQSASRGDLLQQSTRYTMHDIGLYDFRELQDIEVNRRDESETDVDDADLNGEFNSVDKV
ncbi:ARF guanine-nucleotide exchange factor GNL2 [Linum perenne]